MTIWLLIYAATLPLSAQTDFEIKTQQPDLEQEYLKELDKWMLRAYEGDRDAQFKVGVLFTNDQFNKPDYEQAVYWYKQAARQDHVLAQYNLGHQYLTGVGVSKNESTAMKWWLKAAQQNHALAQFNIGRAYYLGIGLQQDHAQSRAWFERAAANNEPKSIEILQQLGWTDSAGRLAAMNLPQAAQSPSAPEIEPNADQQTESEPASQALTSAIAVADIDERDAPSNQGIADVASDQVNRQTNAVSVIEPIEQSTPSTINQTLAQTKTAPADTITRATEQADLPVSQTKPTPSEKVAQKTSRLPIALYTNPSVRSVLIAIVDEREQLEVKRKSGPWSIVTSNVGFPVWVHGDFLLVDGEIGKVTGTSVNARSVPMVMSGTVVGKLENGEWLEVVDSRNGWFRVLAPSRFVAWVKTSEFERPATLAQQSAERSAPAIRESKSEPRPAPSNKPAALLTGPRPINDNEWLFSQAPDTYTLQLASFDDPEKIAEFESRAKFLNNPDLHRFTAKSKDKDIVWTYFLYGAYESTEMAQLAKLEINQRLAWIRNFGQLQQNRCVAWKTQLPTPKELNSYCTG